MIKESEQTSKGIYRKMKIPTVIEASAWSSQGSWWAKASIAKWRYWPSLERLHDQVNWESYQGHLWNMKILTVIEASAWSGKVSELANEDTDRHWSVCMIKSREQMSKGIYRKMKILTVIGAPAWSSKLRQLPRASMKHENTNRHSSVCMIR